jgi:hypothetical protein
MPAAEQAWIDSLRAEAVGVRLVPADHTRRLQGIHLPETAEVARLLEDGYTHHGSVFERPAKPFPAVSRSHSFRPVRAVSRAFDLESAVAAVRSRSAHARSLGAGPNKPLQTRSEGGANFASVRRVVPRIELSNAWS